MDGSESGMRSDAITAAETVSLVRGLSTGGKKGGSLREHSLPACRVLSRRVRTTHRRNACGGTGGHAEMHARTVKDGDDRHVRSLRRESPRLHGSGCHLPRACSASAFSSRVVRASWLPRGRSVRTWRTHFYRGADFRSNPVERQYAKIAIINEIFLLDGLLENISIDI